MYISTLFQQPADADIPAFIRANGFATLVSVLAGKPMATHIPLELVCDEAGKMFLHGHIAKANEQWTTFAENEQVLAIFLGNHAYISSSWYDHVNVPTWNYTAVHIYGTVRILEGDELFQSIKKLTDRYEQASEQPVKMEHFSPKFLTSHLKGLVGFEMEVQTVQATYKLSQNRHDKDYQHIISELEKQPYEGSKGVAQDMRKNRKS